MPRRWASRPAVLAACALVCAPLLAHTSQASPPQLSLQVDHPRQEVVSSGRTGEWKHSKSRLSYTFTTHFRIRNTGDAPVRGVGLSFVEVRPAPLLTRTAAVWRRNGGAPESFTGSLGTLQPGEYAQVSASWSARPGAKMVTTSVRATLETENAGSQSLEAFRRLQPVQVFVIGDSFSSGEGDHGRYTPGSHQRSPRNECHRSPYAPALRAARRQGVGAVESVACSGARISEFYSYNPAPDKQGELAQGAELIGLDPRYVIIGLSGNDVRFGRIVSACFFHAASCSNALSEAEAAYNNLVTSSAVDRLLTTTVGRTQRSKILLVGYPELVEAAEGCGLFPNDVDRRRLLNLQARFNAHLSAAATAVSERHGGRVGYVDLTGVFRGHTMCAPSDQQWFVGRRYIGAPGWENQEVAHPNPVGQSTIAVHIQSAMRRYPG